VKPGDLVIFVGTTRDSNDLSWAEECETYKGCHGFVTSLKRWTNGDIIGALVFFPGLESQGRTIAQGRRDGLHPMLKKELKVVNLR
jgi:hypothetical protein